MSRNCTTERTNGAGTASVHRGRTPVRRMAGSSLGFSCGAFSGTILDNIANAHRQGAGFNPLRCNGGSNIFDDGAVGLNFEHIFSGEKADSHLAYFTPRTDSCVLEQSDQPGNFVVRHPAASSAWGIESTMRYTCSDQLERPHIDLEFTATLTSDRALSHGWVAFMWASYMGHAASREIYFRGERRGGELNTWVAFGSEDVVVESSTDVVQSAHGGSFERGTVGWAGAAPLPHDAAPRPRENSSGPSPLLNVLESPTARFSRPFFFGLMQDQVTDRLMVYAMFFESAECHRFAMWNFKRNEYGQPDPHHPAWDWQFVVKHPQVGKEYSYRARVVYKQFVSAEDVEGDYDAWISELHNKNSSGGAEVKSSNL